ncbi:hypothetical protein [uncultured Arenimonas sp.]|uniref:hypothetical protein n=1 Tax=uncultured Arenimonas sp. TaxID=546226 RepID=UPI0030D7095D
MSIRGAIRLLSTSHRIEIDGSVADGPQSVILQQVANGVPIRMAAIDLLLGADSR